MSLHGVTRVTAYLSKVMDHFVLRHLLTESWIQDCVDEGRNPVHLDAVRYKRWEFQLTPNWSSAYLCSDMV